MTAAPHTGRATADRGLRRAGARPRRAADRLHRRRRRGELHASARAGHGRGVLARGRRRTSPAGRRALLVAEDDDRHRRHRAAAAGAAREPAAPRRSREDARAPPGAPAGPRHGAHARGRARGPRVRQDAARARHGHGQRRRPALRASRLAAGGRDPGLLAHAVRRPDRHAVLLPRSRAAENAKRAGTRVEFRPVGALLSRA